MSHDSAVDRLPALILGSGLNGLGVARSLGRTGVPVYLADTDTRRAELRTRYARPLKLAALNGDALLRDLSELGKTQFAEQRPVLVLTQEQTVRTVASAQDVLRPLFRFLLPHKETLDSLMHKEGFARVATQAGLRMPRTAHVRHRADMEAALTLTFPVVIKPAFHAPQYERMFRKAYRVDERVQAQALLDRILPVLADVIVQEWVPGNDSDIYFCLQQLSENGTAEASFVGRKIRSWPPNVGGTACCTSAGSDADGLAETTERFFRQAGMCGLASMEYKRHSETGEFVAIEPTVGRTDYQEEVAALNGVNLPYAYYRACQGAAARLGGGAALVPSIVWRDREADLRSLNSSEQVVHGFPLHAVVRDALWRANDPWPWAALKFRRLLKHCAMGHSVFSMTKGG